MNTEAYEPVIVTPEQVQGARERVMRTGTATPTRTAAELHGPGKEPNDPEDVDRFLAILDAERHRSANDLSR